MAISSPRISVIATFFNAEGYLSRCVDSLVVQTHPNYEVVLVDDGSADATFEKLNAYASVEKGNVRAIRKENGGPGDARNYGVKHSRGEYVSFVDGDDWISPYYLEMLDDAIVEQGCEFALAAHRVVSGNAESTHWERACHSRRLSQREAVESLLYEELVEAPWSKLAPRALYEEIPFPNKRYEDVAVAASHLLAFGDCAWVDSPIYAYSMRSGSVVHKKNAPIEQLEDFVWAIDEFLGPLEERFPEFASALAFRRSLECARAHSVAALVCDDADRARAFDAILVEQVRAALPAMKGDPRIRRTQLARFIMLAKSPPLYDAFFSVYERSVKCERRA